MTWLKHAERDGRKFLNPVPTTVMGLKESLKLLPVYLRNQAEVFPRKPLGPFTTNADIYNSPPVSGLRVTWFGHSSSLLEIDGLRVLIDPVWDERASPLQWIGPKRFFPPTVPLERLPAVDAVLISHDHYDHLGEGTIRSLAGLDTFQAARWITSLKVGNILTKFGVPAERIAELDWTDSVTLQGCAEGSSLKFTALPARHFSGRSLFNRFQTLWSSFAIEGPKHRVYFGADSGWWDGFEEIGAQHGGFDLTMLEIGAYHPLWEALHLGPDNAARAYAALGGRERAGLLMPIHWGLFNLALHAWRQPMERLEKIAAQHLLPLWCPEPGKPTEVTAPLVSGWWKDS